jgi:hypothetical protein
VMRRPSTPGERERWWRELASLPRECRIAVIRMLSEAVADCPYCDDAVRRCDSRGLVRDRLVHLRCAPPRDLSPGQRDALEHVSRTTTTTTTTTPMNRQEGGSP